MEILNPRELASLIWIGAVVGFLVWKAKAWSLLVGLVKSFFKPILLAVVFLMAVWVTISVWFLARFDLWELANLKTTLIWFFVFALGWMFNVKRWENDPSENAKAALREVLTVTTFVTFFVEFYTFNLIGELIFVPFVSFIAIMAAVAQGNEEHRSVAKLFNGLMMIIGFSLLGYAGWRLVSDLGGFATPDTGREFAVPGLLSLLFIPFMYAVGVWNIYGQVNRMMGFTVQTPAAADFARRRLFWWFWLDTKLLQRWRFALFKLDTETVDDVRRSVLILKGARRRERFKPHVPHEFGWSPYRAARFLAKLDLDARTYDPSYGEWSALSPTRRLEDGTFTDTLRYQITGTEEIATQLKLTFIRDRLRPEDEDTPDSSINALSNATTALLMAVFGARFAEVSRDLTRGTCRAELDGVTVELIENEGTQVIIRHPRHLDPDDVIAERVLRAAGAFDLAKT